MEKEDIVWNDWMRIFIGEIPGEFFIELIFRIALIYLIIMVAMRLMGKRMASRLSRTELVAVVCLSAAIGIPMQAADRGVIPGIIVAFTVVCMQRLLAAWSFKSQWFEMFLQDKTEILIKESVMQTDIMRRIGISRERLFAQLRARGIKQLGEVRRLYQEANGSFCIIKESPVTSGLSILPETDPDMQNTLRISEKQVCNGCGDIKITEEQKCTCGENARWVHAVQ